MRAIIVLLAAAVLLGCVVQETKTNGTAPVPPKNESGPAMNESGKNDSGTMNNSQMLNESAGLEIVASDLNYFDGAKGYLARPKSPGSYPGVIMIHEWWGLNDNIRDMAEMLAARGYAVLAVDLYEGRVAATSDEARALVGSINQSRANENMRAAIAYLRENESAPKMASMGWCFGGGQSLQVSMSGEELDATVIYYGNVNANETQLSAIDWPVLGIFGENDTGIPPSAVNAFESRLDGLGIENDIYIYPGVGHAFANPSGMNYAPDETRDAWTKTVEFLEKNLG
jgi:carboxymethylenebutenolidase